MNLKVILVATLVAVSKGCSTTPDCLAGIRDIGLAAATNCTTVMAVYQQTIDCAISCADLSCHSMSAPCTQAEACLTATGAPDEDAVVNFGALSMLDCKSTCATFPEISSSHVNTASFYAKLAITMLVYLVTF